MDTPSFSGKYPVTRVREHPVLIEFYEVTQRRSTSSDLRYSRYPRRAPYALPFPSCPLSCLVLRRLFTLAACNYRLASIYFLRDQILPARGYLVSAQTRGQSASET